jgi:DNA-binding response OmpR family regulator
VDSHASRLRNKLRASGAELPYVINVWGRGYRLLE